ncbi:MAG: hypothetical protein U0975_06245 [Erythrobacter sp.]|nr:hypothetical protein [Erythrobacter sp.]MDZ4272258.1 hypothetical protein [Erythrobacter sp.]
MPRTTTLTDAFAYFGATTHNVRQAWSAMTPDGKAVVLTIWDHKKGDDGSVDYFDPDRHVRWNRRWGNRERKRHIRHALENCDGKFRVIWVVARDPKADPKTIRDRIADPHTIMQITRYCDETGEFAARPI